MKQIIDNGELLRRFNEDEAVWERFMLKRRMRRHTIGHSPWPITVLDYTDWIEAERECRQTLCIGSLMP